MTLPSLALPIHVRSVGYNEADCGWEERAPGERKRFVQLFWCIRGIGEFVLNNRTVRLAPGEILYHLPGEEHIHRSVDPHSQWCYHWITFDGPGAADFMKSYGYPQANLYAGECPVNLFLEIALQLKQRTPYAQRHAVSIATEILALAGGRLARPHDSNLVKAFIECAHERFHDPGTTIGTIAKELGVHRTTLNRIFYHSMSISPSVYLDQIRIQRALSLLRETEQPIKEVAYLCGFLYTSYFCSVIRRNTGMTPAEYRRSSGLD